jgi:16S rRNA (guanine966-N2)-methyltransferase
MRIVSGQYRGFRFDPPSKIPARPTTDKSKESLFNILQSRFQLDGCNALDLFSGTGNIAYELASHGASNITAIDQNMHSVNYIDHTFKLLKFDAVKIVRADVFKWLKQYVGPPFDLIFADPPYDHIAISDLPELVFKNNMLEKDGILIIEHRSSFNYVHKNLLEKRDYGQSRFSFFKNLND